MTTTDRILAVLALAGLFVFLGVIAWWVKEIDLVIVLALGGGLGLFDFSRTAFGRSRNDSHDGLG
ncbi:MAG: hypothetical protein KKB37_11000 [Alphaproteobacteria bacterium]|nr:hypothetical protein [Alphaproteobacteria bacterium]